MEKKKKHGMTEAEKDAIMQNSNYDAQSGKPSPDNNIFFEERSNPLSSKGN